MERENNIYYARLAEQGERYEDMINFMKIVAKVSLLPLTLFTVWRPALQRGTQLAFCCIQEFSGHQACSLEDCECYSGQRRIQRR